MALLSCDGVTLGYDGKVVVSKLGFEVNKGDYLCIVGENGSGKSTLVKSILGLHGVMSGSIRFGDGIRKGEIGYLPQRTDVGKDFPASVCPKNSQWHGLRLWRQWFAAHPHRGGNRSVPPGRGHSGCPAFGIG